MSTLNINGDVNDPYYRYKMPRLFSMKAGKGNGCYTILENLPDVTKAFNHPPSVVFKYMGNCIGTNTTESNWRINGHHTDDELFVILYKYINSFVICPNCGIPELLPTIEGKKKNKKLILTCSACGKSEIKTHNSKDEEKGIDLIIKYLDGNVWTITKGSMVEQLESEMFDPFSDMLSN